MQVAQRAGRAGHAEPGQLILLSTFCFLHHQSESRENNLYLVAARASTFTKDLAFVEVMVS